MISSANKDIVNKLKPVLSKKEREEIISYFNVYLKYEKDFSEKAREDLKDHPVFGKLIRDIPREVSEAGNRVSQALQKDAILNDNWIPYIEHSIEQGNVYAKMGLDFKSWYEVVMLVKNYLRPYLYKEYGNSDEFLSSLDGMNRFMDIAMGIIGEAYMQEKEGIIKQANEELTERAAQLELFASIVNSSDDAIISKTLDGIITSWNHGAEKIFGYTKEEITGKHISILTPPHLLNEEPEITKNISEGLFVDHYETQRITKSGKTLDVSLTISPIKDLNGKVIGASKISRDITERKKAEKEIHKLNEELELKVKERTAQLERNIQQLIESEEKFQKAFQSSAAGITITRLSDFTYLEVNNAFTEMTGYRREELLNHSSEDLGIISNLDKREEVLKQIEERGFAKDIEMEAWTKSGAHFDILTSIETIILNGEKYAINIIYDITERKRAEEQLEAANKELEAFTYSVSHDLRAPLRAIYGYSQILKEDNYNALDDEGKKNLESILRNSKQMETLIDDLLTFSRLGRKELSTSMLNMDNLVKDICNELILDGVKNKIELKTSKLPAAEGDYTLIRQVWTNLISNAIKFSNSKPEIKIEIGAKPNAEKNVYYIKDNGAGFNMRFYDKLFGVFQRLHSKAEFEGTGVGLAIVKRIINKHNGEIWAESKVNEGACFYFSLPSDKTLK